MCGICGFINFDRQPANKDILLKMNSQLIHRGPDEHNTKIFGHIGLGHCRLSIIDLQKGQQPLANEDETIWIIYNGETYNFLYLKRRLEQKGHVFKTNCDTEVILHLYEEYGKNCVNYLEGMFAFAIYDKNLNCMLLAKDRMGQKPLFYYQNKNVFVFASELQSLIEHPEISKEINLQGIHDYLTLQYIPAPFTIYKNVFKLLPANILELDTNNNVLRCLEYWHCSFDNKTNISYEDAKAELKYLLKDAVKKRLIADVPLGSFLSGGIDSTITTGLMAELSETQITTFTIGFNENKYDERKYAKIAADKFKTHHYEKIVVPSDFTILKKLVKHYGEPYADSSMLPTYFLSQFTREHVKAALSGDGGDELFAGYYRYMIMKYASLTDFLPILIKKSAHNLINTIIPKMTEERSFFGKIHRILNAITTNTQNRHLEIIGKCSESLKKTIYGEQFANFAPINTQKYLDKIYSSATAKNNVELAMEIDLKSYLHNDVLTKVDIASMANGLEIRTPFLDHNVVSFAISLPIKFKQSTMKRKKILVDTFKGLIPPALLARNKMGFGVPISKWLRNEWKTILEETLLEGHAIKNGYFSKQTVADLIKKHQNNQADCSYILWALLIFELWYNEFII